MIVDKILDHKEQAIENLRQQYKGRDKIKGLMDGIIQEIQNLEDIFIELRDERTLYIATGAQLDAWGTVLNQKRNGLDDNAYRLILLGQVAVNVSKGTPEDMISVFMIFTNPDYISFNEIYPASMQLTTVGGEAIGSVEDIKAALRRAAPAGVSIDLFMTAPGNPFVFADDPDPNGRGFGDLDNPDVGGYLVSFF
jgi:hypothetical protein